MGAMYSSALGVLSRTNVARLGDKHDATVRSDAVDIAEPQPLANARPSMLSALEC